MKRDQYKTVTRKESFAILLPASQGEAMGLATFLSQDEAGIPSHVRLFNLFELKNVRRGLKGIEAKQFDALVALRGALESHDGLALTKATERMEQVYQMRVHELERHQPRSTDAALRSFRERLVESVRPSPETRSAPARLFSLEVSRMVGFLQAQIVLWWWDDRFIPAIFCLDSTTALYLHTFFIAPTGELGFRICPHCHQSFFQERTNQSYCVPAHREAHRVARFRSAKKSEGRGKSRREHGTDETR